MMNYKEILKKWKSLNKGTKNFFIRLIIFLSIYVSISHYFKDFKLLLNQNHFATNDGFLSFFLYFLIILTIYLRREKILKFPNYQNNIFQTLIFLLLGIGILFIPAIKLADIGGLSRETLFFGLYALANFLIFLGIFNIKFFTKYFYEEIALLLLISVSYMSFYFIVKIFWTQFFAPIALTLKVFLPLISSNSQVGPITDGFKVSMNDFNVVVGPPCAGIYSMLAFSFLFLTAIYYLKKQNKINKFKAISSYLIGVLTMYCLNILRIGIIIYIGAYHSPELALNLFHEYLSAIFLMSVFLIYLYFVIPRITAKSLIKNEIQ